MKNVLLAIIICFGLVGFTQVQDVEAASCWGSVTSAYKSGGNMYAFASFSCTGKTGTGKVCIDSVCSSSVSIPNGGTRTASVVKQVVCVVNSTAYSTAWAAVNGSSVSSKSIKRCG